MAKRALPNLGLVGNFADGEDNWGADMDASLLKLSTLVQGGVKSRLAAVPGVPAQGDAHVLTAAPNAQNVAVYDGGAWTYYPPSEGWWLYDRNADKYISFNGAAWVEYAGGGGGGGGVPEAPVDGKTYGRKDATWSEVIAGGGPVNPSVEVIPVFSSGWTNFDPSENTFQVLKATKLGRLVHLTGLITGPQNTQIATMPPGWRPEKSVLTAGLGDSGPPVRVDIGPAGQVVCGAGSTGYLALDVFYRVSEADEYSPIVGGGGGGSTTDNLLVFGRWAADFNHTGDGDPLLPNNLDKNIGGAWNAGTGTFTVPSTGYYRVESWMGSSNPGAYFIQAIVNGVDLYKQQQYWNDAIVRWSGFDRPIYLQAGDALRLHFSRANNPVYFGGKTGSFIAITKT